MTTEPGSDEHLAQVADLGAVGRAVRRQRLHSALEEARLRATPAADDPGRDHPDPDESPPASESHPEFDPLPPRGPRD